MWISGNNSSCESLVSMKLFISPTTDIFSIWPISVLGCFSSKWFFSDIMDSRNCRKNFEIKVKTKSVKTFSYHEASDCLSIKVKKYLTYFLKYITKPVILKNARQDFCSLFSSPDILLTKFSMLKVIKHEF